VFHAKDSGGIIAFRSLTVDDADTPSAGLDHDARTVVAKSCPGNPANPGPRIYVFMGVGPPDFARDVVADGDGGLAER
jgi:hypothetical protein